MPTPKRAWLKTFGLICDTVAKAIHVGTACSRVFLFGYTSEMTNGHVLPSEGTHEIRDTPAQRQE